MLMSEAYFHSANEISIQSRTYIRFCNSITALMLDPDTNAGVQISDHYHGYFLDRNLVVHDCWTLQ